MKQRELFLFVVLWVGTPVYSECMEILDTSEVKDVDGEGDGVVDYRIPEELSGHEVHTIFLAGFGGGYFSNPGYETFIFTFFLAHLWEIWKYGAIRAAGEVTTNFGDALSVDIAGGFNVYPFQYGTTPYLGIEAGYGYGQVGGESDYGLSISAEAGVFAFKVSNVHLAASARITLKQSNLTGQYPLGYSVRFGFLL